MVGKIAGCLLACSFVFIHGNSNPFAKASLLLRQPVLCDTVPLSDSSKERVFEKVEIEAFFPGGEPAWKDFLGRTLNPKVPARKKAPKGAYTVWVQFVVDKEGRLSEFRSLTSHGFGMEEEVIRAIKKSPRWVPASQDGRAVKAYRKQPITFLVE